MLSRASFSSVCQNLLFSRLVSSGFTAKNEPILQYEPGSKERREVLAAAERIQSRETVIPVVIGDEEITESLEVRHQVVPFDHNKSIAKFHYANKALIQKGIDTSLKARHAWDRTPFSKRADIFLKAADLLAHKYRMDVCAATMLGQGKTMVQAEIDAAAELVDFLRFNVQNGLQLLSQQPLSTAQSSNSLHCRGCEGFWAAISPFNFTAIGGNLSSAPAMMGNVVQWKPSDTAMLSNYLVYKIFREAGLPAGVINFVPADGPTFGQLVCGSPHLVGVNFTGSVRTFRWLWLQVAQNLAGYRTYPRLIGECGGKNFHLVHKTANLDSVVNGTILSAFEYGGQKCSACSRAYIPRSLWPTVKERLQKVIGEINVGPATQPSSLYSAVIDKAAFDRINSYLKHAQASPNLTVLAGGKADDSSGYYVQPTLLETTDPNDRIMQEEIFGPVLTVYPYPDEDYERVIELIDNTSPFSLTGAVFANDKAAIDKAVDRLYQAAGNLYINDKSTGSIVGQQPFGGARASGTNDKAGGPNYLLRFCSPLVVKETSVPLTTWRYPSMET